MSLCTEHNTVKMVVLMQVHIFCSMYTKTSTQSECNLKPECNDRLNTRNTFNAINGLDTC